MNLILCCTVRQLINAIDLLEDQLKREETDLFLCGQEEFQRSAPALEQIGLFHGMYKMPAAERQKAGIHPESFTEFPEFQTEYRHLYIPDDNVFGKELYYHLLNSGAPADIHCYEDGLGSYIKDCQARTLQDGISHQRCGNAAYGEHIVERYLYEPSLFCGKNFDRPVRQLKKLTEDNPAVPVLRELFGKTFDLTRSAEEPFVFFTEAFIERGEMVEDIPMLDRIADIVGKDNILVEIDPKEKMDRFSRYGYKVEKRRELPWEVQLLCCVKGPKALVSFSSAANLTAKMVFQEDMYSVYLYRFPVIGAASSLNAVPNMRSFMSRANSLYGKSGQLYVPGNYDELKENLLYIGGMIHG